VIEGGEIVFYRSEWTHADTFATLAVGMQVEVEPESSPKGHREGYSHAVTLPIADPNTDAGQERWPGGLCEAVGAEDTEALRLITSALWAAFRWTLLRLVQRQGTGITLDEHVQELFTVLLLFLAYATEPLGNLGISLLSEVHRLQERLIGALLFCHIDEQRFPTIFRDLRGERAGGDCSTEGEECITQLRDVRLFLRRDAE
jgi:hypothetical protein